MSELLKEIGLSQDELANRVVTEISSRLLGLDDVITDDYLWKKLKKLISEQVDKSVADVANKHVLPKVSESIEAISLQETNRWGESKGQAVTFTEYLAGRADAYMTEKVDYYGKSKKSYTDKDQTRIQYLIDQSLKSSVEIATREAMRDMNEKFSKGIQGLVADELKKAVKRMGG